MNRAQLISLRVEECIRQTPMRRRDFVARVREHYEHTVAPEYRTIDFSVRSDLFDRLEADEEKVFQMLENTTRRRLPVELEESILAALPDDRRFRLQIELGEREGVLVVPMPAHSRCADAMALGRLSKEIGDVFTRYAPILADGEINADDAKNAGKAVIDIDEAIAVLHEMRAALIDKALSHKTPVVPLRGLKK